MASRAEADSALHRSSKRGRPLASRRRRHGIFLRHRAHHDRRPHWKTSAGHAQDSHRHQPRGGDLLRAVRLAYLIEDAFGEDMPLSALFEAQTVVGLAALMRIRASARTTSVDRHPSLVVIRHGTSARPLFIVPGGHGGPVEVALYSRLLRPLEGGRAIYCLRTPGFEESGPHSATVSGIAEAHLKAMRSVQLQGPYLVMGECAGGAVAFEIAQQLLERDQTAASLVLLDSWCPSAAGEFHYRWVERPLFVLKDRLRILKSASADLSGVIRGHIEALQRLPLRQRRRQLLDAIESLFRITKNWGVRLTQIEAPELDQNPDREKAYVRTLMRYRPRTYPGRVTLIATEFFLAAGHRRRLAIRCGRRIGRSRSSRRSRVLPE